MAAKLARSTRAGRDPLEGRALLKVGDLLAGKYRVERILGEGGMGVVVAAHHELLDQEVAVKLLYQDVADREAQSRLLLEARSAAKLQSDHVARVVDVDTGADGLPFIVMELLDGADLCQIADARGALPRWLVVDYLLQALEGLAHAHARGIVHRDLKPSNLFLANKPDGTQIIKILDFGISKSTEGGPGDRRSMQLTGGRAVLGSPPYMSPEQVRAPKSVDHRTDIWSMGICMYELLTNSMPFGGEEIQETFAQILEKEPVPIRALVAGVPEGLEQVVMRCLAKNRDDRFGDVGELARALVPYGSGTWMQAADRIVSTLTRAAEDATSGARIKGTQPSSMDRLAIPSSPGRRVDSLQPEFHGTAATVAKGFTVFDGSSKRWILFAVGVFSLAGLGLMGLTTYRHSRAEAAPVDSAAVAGAGTAATPTDPPPDTVTLPPGVVTPPAPQAGADLERPPIAAPPGTILGASTPSPPSPSATATAKHPGSGRPPPATAAPPPRRPSSPPATVSTQRPSLPPGLPRSRD